MENKQVTLVTYVPQTKKYFDVQSRTIKIQPIQIDTIYQSPIFFKLLGSPQEPRIVHKLSQSTNCYNIQVYGLFTYTVKIKQRSSCQNVFISTALILLVKIH